MARTPFKLKSSPTKGKLDDFFQNLGENLKRNKKDIGDEMSKKYGTGDYASGGSKAKERMRAGESKFQYDVRRKRAKKDQVVEETTKDPINIDFSLTGQDFLDQNNPEITKPLPTYEEAYNTSKTDPKFKKRFPNFKSFKDAAELYNSPEQVEIRKKK